MSFCAQEKPNQPQPMPTGKLVVFSAFYTVIDRIGGMICEVKPVTIEQIGCAANKYCSNLYSVLKPQDEGSTKLSCLWGHYVIKLLTKGYKLVPKKNIFVTKELEGHSLSWITGAVLANTERYFSIRS